MLCLSCVSLSEGMPPEPRDTVMTVSGEPRDAVMTVSGEPEVRRSRRSLTALLAAEVLFLERILAAQTAAREAGSRKPRKISRPAPAPLIGNRKVV